MLIFSRRIYSKKLIEKFSSDKKDVKIYLINPFIKFKVIENDTPSNL